MTKLEWCRANAPDAYQDLSDSEILEKMSNLYEKYGKDEVDEVINETVELNECNNYLDSMVNTLVSAFGDKLAFKGGYMLTKLMPNCARQTEDIDFSIASSDLYASLIETMRAIGEQFISDGFIASYKIKDTIQPRMSGGMDMYASDGHKVLGIDIGWHDLSFGTTTTKIDVCELESFTIERMLSDKITAILSRKRFRRPKDIYDLYCITNCFDFDFDLVNDFILKRTEGVGADWQNYPFTAEILTEYAKAYNKLQLNSIVAGRELVKPDFEKVIYRFNVICSCLLQHEHVTWNHNDATCKEKH